MALGSVVTEMRALINEVKTLFTDLIKSVEEIRSSQKRLEAVVASMLDKPKK